MPEIGTTELMQRTGVTHRQINYWCRNGVLPSVTIGSPGTGQRRIFHDSVVERVSLLVKVSKAFDHNIRVETLKLIFDQYYRERLNLGNGIILTWKVEGAPST